MTHIHHDPITAVTKAGFKSIPISSRLAPPPPPCGGIRPL